METSTVITKLEPDVSRISESLRALADELPRISNLESTAVLRAVQDLREDIRHGKNTLLNDKLDRILESLSSLECRIGKLERPNIDSRKDEIKVEDRHISESSQAIATEPTSGSPRQEPLSTDRVQGASGALLLIVATLIPIFFALVYL